MGRRPRTHVSGCLYHVIARGNSRQPIFFGDEDYLRFLALLDEVLRELEHDLHAYCLMTNHVHLLLRTSDVPVSAVAHRVMSRFSRWQNRRLGRSGHLFERRHRSILVETNEQLLRLLRYIHNNPLRAGLATECSAYRWSSHRAYLGEPCDVHVDTTLGLATLDPDSTRARARYRVLVDSPDSPDSPCGEATDELDLVGGVPPARTAARAGIWPLSPSHRIALADLVAVTASVSSCASPDLAGSSRARHLTRARAAAAFIASEQAHLTLTQLAVLLRRDPSTLSEAAQRFRRSLPRDARSRELLAAIRAGLMGA
jgi:putative transposase